MIPKYLLMMLTCIVVMSCMLTNLSKNVTCLVYYIKIFGESRSSIFLACFFFKQIRLLRYMLAKHGMSSFLGLQFFDTILDFLSLYIVSGF